MEEARWKRRASGFPDARPWRTGRNGFVRRSGLGLSADTVRCAFRVSAASSGAGRAWRRLRPEPADQRQCGGQEGECGAAVRQHGSHGPADLQASDQEAGRAPAIVYMELQSVFSCHEAIQLEILERYKSPIIPPMGSGLAVEVNGRGVVRSPESAETKLRKVPSARVKPPAQRVNIPPGSVVWVNVGRRSGAHPGRSSWRGDPCLPVGIPKVEHHWPDVGGSGVGVKSHAVVRIGAGDRQDVAGIVHTGVVQAGDLPALRGQRRPSEGREAEEPRGRGCRGCAGTSVNVPGHAGEGLIRCFHGPFCRLWFAFLCGFL